MADQFSVKYRPIRLQDMVTGSPEVLDLAESVAKKAQAVMITGQSGCGKSTLARILNRMINGEAHTECMIYRNCAGESGKSAIAEVQSFVQYNPRGKKHVVVLDEVHALSPQAMDALLVLIEDPPHSKILFILCTNQPFKLKATLIDRCRKLALVPPSAKDLAIYVFRIMKTLKLPTPVNEQKRLAMKIAKATGCVPRAAMQALEDCVDLIRAGKSIDVIEKVVAKTEDGNIDKMVGSTLIALYSSLKDNSSAGEAALYLLENMPTDAMSYLTRLQSANYFGMQMIAGGRFQWQGKVCVEALKSKSLKPSIKTMLHVSCKLNDIRERLVNIVTDPSILIGTGIASICLEKSNEN